MTWLLSKIGGALWPVIAAVAASLLTALGVQTLRLQHSQAQIAEVKTAWAAAREQSTAAAVKASTEYRALEAQMQAQAEKAERTYHAAQTRNDSALAAARVDAGKLRSQLAAFARGGGPAVDTQAAASGRAEALGGVLEGVLRDYRACTADAESASDGVRALKAAWPSSVSLGKLRLGGN